MASFQKRKTSKGATRIIAIVRIRPYNLTSKSFPDKAAAKAWATATEIELRKKRDQGNKQVDLTTLTLGDLIRRYLASPQAQELRHLEGRQRLLSWWISHYGTEKVREFGPIKLSDACDVLRKKRGPATTNRYLGALRSCWSWGRKMEFVGAEQIWPTMLFLKEPDARVRFLNDDELKAVLTAAEKHAPWMHAAILTSLATGVRQGELLRLEWKDVDFEKKTVTVLISKNKKRRVVHLPDPAIDALKKMRIVGPKLIFVRPNGEPADKSFLTFHWNEVRKAAGLVDFRWHDLRHSCASYYAQAGAGLLEIGWVLGHSSPSITAKYAHLVAGKPITGADKLAEKLRLT